MVSAAPASATKPASRPAVLLAYVGSKAAMTLPANGSETSNQRSAGVMMVAWPERRRGATHRPLKWIGPLCLELAKRSGRAYQDVLFHLPQNVLRDAPPYQAFDKRLFRTSDRDEIATKLGCVFV